MIALFKNIAFVVIGGMTALFVKKKLDEKPLDKRMEEAKDKVLATKDIIKDKAMAAKDVVQEKVSGFMKDDEVK